MMRQWHLRIGRLPVLGLTVLWALVIALPGITVSHANEDEMTWADLRENLYEGRELKDGSHLLSLTAPYRALDAAIVPVEIQTLQPDDKGVRFKSLTLVIDENPAPVAAVFKLVPEAKVNYLSTRVRVNAYTYMRVIGEAEDGALYMVRRYVKASGGCSAPASKNADEALASLGQMRFRDYTEKAAGGASSSEREVQLQIRHPNYSGLQMDQLTGHYRPAHFVRSINITGDGKPVMSVEGAISLSENPTIRFKYQPQGAEEISAHAEDTEDNVFEKSWQLNKLGPNNS